MQGLIKQYECRHYAIKRKAVLVLWDPSLSLRDDTVFVVWAGKKWRFDPSLLFLGDILTNRHFLPHTSPYLPVIPSVSEESFK
jgi:hypothetical protein